MKPLKYFLNQKYLLKLTNEQNNVEIFMCVYYGEPLNCDCLFIIIYIHKMIFQKEKKIGLIKTNRNCLHDSILIILIKKVCLLLHIFVRTETGN